MQSTIGPIYKKDDEIKCSDRGSIFFFVNYKKFNSTTFLKMNSMCRGNYLGSLMWLLIKEVNY